MIQGVVAGLEARLEVAIGDEQQPALIRIEFVVDSGFAGALTLPPDAVATLELPFIEEAPATLADGTTVAVSVHRAEIRWDGRHIAVAVLALGGPALLGTSLLAGFNLNADFIDGGCVTLTRLDP